MKILHISPSYKPAYVYGGPTFSVSLLCEKLAETGHQITVYTTTANGTEELDVPLHTKQHVDGVDVFYFRRWTKDHSHLSPSLYSKLWRTINCYEAVHIHSWWNLVAMPAVVICLLKGIKPIISIRGGLSDFTFTHSKRLLKGLFHRLVGSKLLAHGLIHATSQKEWKECSLSIPDMDGFILPNYINLPDKIVQRENHREPLQFIFLGRIHPVKNLELIFEALRNLDFNWKLTIIGTGQEDYILGLQQKAKALNIQQHLQWAGRKNGDEKYQLLANADVLLQLSHTENFSNAIIEALSQGTAICTLTTVGLADYIQEKGFGTVSDNDLNDVIEKLKQMYSDTAQRAIIRATAPLQVRADFSSAALINRYIYQYQMVSSHA